MQSIKSLNYKLQDIKLFYFVLYLEDRPISQVIFKSFVDCVAYCKKHVVSRKFEKEVDCGINFWKKEWSKTVNKLHVEVRIEVFVYDS